MSCSAVFCLPLPFKHTLPMLLSTGPTQDWEEFCGCNMPHLQASEEICRNIQSLPRLVHCNKLATLCQISILPCNHFSNLEHVTRRGNNHPCWRQQSSQLLCRACPNNYWKLTVLYCAEEVQPEPDKHPHEMEGIRMWIKTKTSQPCS